MISSVVDFIHRSTTIGLILMFRDEQRNHVYATLRHARLSGRESGGLSTARNGSPFDIFGFSRGDVAATAPRGTYFATRHHEAFRIERRR